MTKTYLIKTDDQRWLAFRLVATKKGLRVKDAIIDAIDLYIREFQEENKDFKIEIVRLEQQRNLRAILDEQELIAIITQLIKRPRKTYDPFRTELKEQLKRKLRQGLVITDRVAEELRNLIKQCPEDFSPEVVESITALVKEEKVEINDTSKDR